MAIYQVETFDDIVDAIREELKIQSGDTASIARIKRNVNVAYLQRVVPFKRWPWLTSSFDVSLPAYISTGTVSVTENSATITFSSGPAVDLDGYWFSLDGSDKRYRISAHTAAGTSATLEVAYVDATATGQSFKVWKDTLALAATVRETIEITRDDKYVPIESAGLQEMRRLINQDPKLEAPPQFYHTLLNTDGSRTLMVWPSLQDQKTTLHVDAVRVVSPLELDADEPLIPPQYRHVLVYGGLASSWVRERNETTATLNEQLFRETLGLMAGKVEDSTDYPVLVPSRQYLQTKRNISSRRRRGRWGKD